MTINGPNKNPDPKEGLVTTYTRTQSILLPNGWLAIELVPEGTTPIQIDASLLLPFQDQEAVSVTCAELREVAERIADPTMSDTPTPTP